QRWGRRAQNRHYGHWSPSWASGPWRRKARTGRRGPVRAWQVSSGIHHGHIWSSAPSSNGPEFTVDFYLTYRKVIVP
ncbi:MAG TPA: hypothetical protein VHN16_16680, partial [Streptosporangiaceae bacterium]|nr:hypothetical protein [Streptosporangiaceae bacterium]